MPTTDRHRTMFFRGIAWGLTIAGFMDALWEHSKFGVVWIVWAAVQYVTYTAADRRAVR